MDLLALLPRLQTHKAAILTYEDGLPVRHAHAEIPLDVQRTVERLARFGVKRGMRIGIYAPNSYAWIVHDLALIQLGAVSVPFTDDFASLIDPHLLDHYAISLLLISKNYAHLFSEKPDFVAFIDDDASQARAIPRPQILENSNADEISLVFSSGSAGGLKGLVLSKKGIEANLQAIMKAVDCGQHDRWLLFLPMSNFQQRGMYYAALWYDFDMIVTDPVRLYAAMRDLKPTLLIAPPMFFETIENRVSKNAALRGAGQKFISGLLSWVPGEHIRLALARIFFSDFHSIFGGRMRLLITGMAPIRKSAVKLFAQMHMPIAESYGLIEIGSLTFRPPNSRRTDSVGKILNGTSLRFADDGEIIVRRKNGLAIRYFQCADGENERTFLDSGEVATGDIGRLDPDGHLILLGRKKEVIITPGGVKIHPEVAEAEIEKCPVVEKCVVLARSDSPVLVAIVRLAEMESEALKAEVARHIDNLNRTRNAAKIGETIFTDQIFSRENGMLRPNLKLDRRNIAKHFNI